MNFLSGLLVLILGLGTINEIITYFSPKETLGTKITFYLGRFLLLLWLTSGMWAFLVFVDNKTDLWVMAITMLWMLSWFIFLNYEKNHKNKQKTNTLKYIIISWIFFALAAMSKQTAFIDIALFWLILVSLRINNIIAIGLGVIITGITGILQIANAKDIINPETGKQIVIAWIIITIIGIIQWYIQKHFKNIKKNILNIWIWAISIVITLIIFKWTHILYSQMQKGDFSIGTFTKSLLLATNSVENLDKQTIIDQDQKENLSPEECKIINFSEEELNKNLQKAVVWNEDVWRYVWYGRKEFTKTKGLNIGYWLLRLMYPKDNTCYWLNKDAKILCNNSDLVLSFNLEWLKWLLDELNPKSKSYGIVEKAISNAEKKWQVASIIEYRDEALSIKQYYENHAIRTENGKIFIPYRYIIPLNISFNRSLQNLSSYYTDIWFIRLFTMVFIVLGLLYWYIKNNKTLISISSIWILWRAIWWIIGWWILWYGLWLVIWTILSSIIYINELIHDSKKESDKNLLYFFLIIFAIRWIIQIFFNFIRISSQGTGGPFSWYKMNTGKSMELDENLQQKTSIVNSYTRKDVFDLQFPYYNKFIEQVKWRKDTDGVLIAWTYIQYFLHNQKNIVSDGMVGWLREDMSDNDSCKSSIRLKKKNIKYIVIDPNIWTVGMGEGNETLFHRFFAKLDSNQKIESHGAISMLIKMNQDWFIKLINTNNLWTKYALILDDNKFKEYFWSEISDEEIILLRSKLAVARYFQDVNNYVNFISKIFIERIDTKEVIGDIADVYGKVIDENKVTTAATTLLEAWSVTPQLLQSITKAMNQDERIILSQYLWIVNLKKSNSEKLPEIVNSMLSQSLWWGSQIIALEIL